MEELERAIQKREETLLRFLAILQGYIGMVAEDVEIADNMRDYWMHLADGAADWRG